MKRNHSFREKSVKPVVHVGGAVGVWAGLCRCGRSHHPWRCLVIQQFESEAQNLPSFIRTAQFLLYSHMHTDHPDYETSWI